MNDQYYTREPESASHPVSCAVLFRGHSLQFETDAGVFSKGELDKGTELLLSALPPLHGAVLDMGCGWGPVGVSVKKDDPALQLTMVDVNHAGAGALGEKRPAERRAGRGAGKRRLCSPEGTKIRLGHYQSAHPGG